MPKSKSSAEAAKSNKPGLIIGIAAGVLILCCCVPGIGGPVIWYVLQQKPTAVAKKGDQDKEETKKLSSPKEVFDAICLAAQKDDLRAWCECVTDDSRDLLAASVIVDEYAMRQRHEKNGTEMQKTRIRAVANVFKQHGLTEEFLEKLQREQLTISHSQAPMEAKVSSARAILTPVRDRNGFIEDFFGAIQKGPGAEKPLSLWKKAKLTDVVITDKIARGTVNFEGRREAQVFDFRIEQGGWRLDLFAETPSDLPPGHP